MRNILAKPQAAVTMFVLLISASTGAAGAESDATTRPAPPSAAGVQQVDLESFRLIAVQNDGRLKTFDTLAREIVHGITGRTFFERPGADGRPVPQDPVFTYLDMIFRPQEYRPLRMLYVKKKPVRDALVLAAGGQVDAPTLNAILKDGRVSQAFLDIPAVRARLADLQRDVMRTAKEVENLENAARLCSPRLLKGLMRVVPPPSTSSADARWYSVTALAGRMPADSVHGALAGEAIAGMDPATQATLSKLWDEAGKSWSGGDAASASAALNALAAGLPAVAPAVYPAHAKLAMEHAYYRYNKLTWAWWFYLLAVVFLLMGIVYRWPRAWTAGAVVFAIAFALHTLGSAMRWYVAGRIPNTNMFEAVTATAWFGVGLAIFYELGPTLARHRSAWRGAWAAVIGGTVVFIASLAIRGVPFHAWQQWGPVPITAMIGLTIGSVGLVAMVAGRQMSTNGLALLGSAVVAMVGLFCGNFMSADLSDISARMPVLNDVWLYIHTNMIIAAYALIGMAYVTAAMYLVGRLLTHPSRALFLSMAIPSVLILAIAAIPGIGLMMILPAWLPFVAVVALVPLCQILRVVFGTRIAARSRSVWEGTPLAAASLAGASGSVGAQDAGPTPGEGLARVLDGATMLLLELSFITLWLGIIMGAIWADHSWGRPWGWDPKEVFALNTWIIFLILVHVRLKVQDKPLWTAVLAVVGTSVMMFNWIVVNFFITGLHSYA